MTDWQKIGLNEQMFSVDSPLAGRDKSTNLKDYIDQKIGNIERPGGISYYQTQASNREFKAVIGFDSAGGKFTDIQVALNYVNSQGGGRILVLPGTYNINSNLTIYSNTELTGLTLNSVVLDFGLGTNNIKTATGAGAIAINYLTIQNSGATSGAVFVDSADDVYIERCFFNNNHTPIGGTYTGGLYVRYNTSSSSDYFIRLNRMRSTNIVEGNFISNADYVFYGDTDGHGAGLTNYLGNVINNDAGVINGWISGKFNYAFFSGNMFLASGTITFANPAVNFSSSSPLSFQGNTIRADLGAGGQAINLGNCSYVSFLGNAIFSKINGSAAISLGTTNYSQINGNSVYATSGSASDGIKLNSSLDNIINGNFIYAGTPGTSYGVNIADGTCSENVVVGNFLQGNTADTNNAGTLSVIANNA